jgi:hypothetical protein
MNTATEFYSLEWDVEDVHGTESYDLICRQGGEVKHGGAAPSRRRRTRSAFSDGRGTSSPASPAVSVAHTRAYPRPGNIPSART